MKHPPRFLERLLESLLPEGAQDTVLGDLLEEYDGQARRLPLGVAPLWYVGAGLAVAVYYALDGLGSARGLRSDVAEAGRKLRRAPGFAFLAVLGIGVAVGANVLTLSLAQGVVLAPLPFPAAERLGMVTYDFSGSESDGFGLAYRDVLELQERSTVIERAASVMDWVHVDLVGEGEAQRLSASFLGPGYLELLGAEPVLGRGFTEDESGPGAGAPFVLLSRGFWTQELGGDPRVVGRTLQLNGVTATVVGILPGESHDLRHRFGTAADVYLPLFSAELLLGQDLTERRGSGPLNVLVRLRPGATFEEARGELGRISGRLAITYPESNEGWTFHLERLEDVFYQELRTPVAILLSGALLVLLLVTFNLAGLLLVRALGRRQEATIRRVLGAAPGGLLRLSLAETSLLALAGGVLGFLMAWVGADILQASALMSLPTFAPVRITANAVAVAFLFLLGLAVVLGLTGWAPLGFAPSAGALRSGTRHTSSRGARRARSLLVVGEVGLAFALLVGAGLLLRSFTTLRSTDMGFEAERLLTLKLELRGERYESEDAQRALARQIVDRASSVAGVEDAFLWSPHGIGEGSWVDLLTREGRWDLHPTERLEASRHHVLPGTMERAGIRVLQGRGFQPSDDAGSPEVALVSESLARRMWPGEDPVGKALESRSGGKLRVGRVVGVAEDAYHRSRLANPFGPQLDVYYPFDQWPQSRLSVAARLTPGASTSQVASTLRERVGELDPTLPLYDMATMSERLREEEARTRLVTLLVAGYATLAALLASMGIYGVLAESVKDRTREIGVRLALGARKDRVVGRVALGGLATLVPGALAGLVMVGGGSRLLESALYGVEVWDPVVLSAAALLLLLVGTGASLRPALRAAAVDPSEALREE